VFKSAPPASEQVHIEWTWWRLEMICRDSRYFSQELRCKSCFW